MNLSRSTASLFGSFIVILIDASITLGNVPSNRQTVHFIKSSPIADSRFLLDGCKISVLRDTRDDCKKTNSTESQTTNPSTDSKKGQKPSNEIKKSLIISDHSFFSWNLPFFTWPIASKLATHPHIDLIKTSSLESTEPIRDWSMYDEIVVMVHEIIGQPNKISSGDTPQSLAAKLRKRRINKYASIELVICNGGTAQLGSDKQSFASLLAAYLDRPIIAYTHPVRVEASYCFKGCNTSRIVRSNRLEHNKEGTKYEYLISDKPIDRRLYYPNKSSSSISGIPNIILINNLKKANQPSAQPLKIQLPPRND
ncbi:hypothetical protein AM1_G0169 (plasmid) [Acaryochloris marina MBIC11017]|uniref:Uncharacterized protein n=2 Tax=Acaryochloris marina TaxID=155978 RepID=A8ZQR3_ACAM1|nr:hypothetical protein AM1_G0169 [Acaryochloris marina MBIC11017]